MGDIAIASLRFSFKNEGGCTPEKFRGQGRIWLS